MLRRFVRSSTVRTFGNIPFKDDLTAADNELFGLEDFQHYNGTINEKSPPQTSSSSPPSPPAERLQLDEIVRKPGPLIVVSQLNDPHKNLAIEDFVYNNIPLEDEFRSQRLMFYTNSPCVVIGKNQNPWKEVNIPILNSLGIPLLRRKSGGGTVVHDLGNVNYSFMTTKAQFNRFTFVELIKRAVNGSGKSPKSLDINERGDIVTTSEGNDYKVSGSAYKLSKGKSYHHGTMLLRSKLEVLRQILSDKGKIGTIDAKASVNSVKSAVTNVGIDNSLFVEIVLEEFKRVYGEEMDLSPEQKAYNEDFGLGDFVEGMKDVAVFGIDEETELNNEIIQTAEELKQWEWKYGATPQFSHKFTNESLGFTVKLEVGKKAIVEKCHLEVFNPTKISKESIEESFHYLREYIDSGKLQYTGSNVAGFVVNDEISDWIGRSIDGTV